MKIKKYLSQIAKLSVLIDNCLSRYEIIKEFIFVQNDFLNKTDKNSQYVMSLKLK